MELAEVRRTFKLTAAQFIVLAYLRQEARYEYAPLEEIQHFTALGRQTVVLACVMLESHELVDLRFKRSGAVKEARAVTDATLKYRRAVAAYQT